MRRYTVTRDIIDNRDYRASDLPTPAALPQKTTNVHADGPIRDQGQEGSCTAFTGHGAMQLLKGINGSPKQLYYSERFIDKDVRQDAGSTGRTLVQALRKVGICREELCPYDGKLRTRPLTKAMADDASHHLLGSGYRVSSVDEARGALALGLPLAIGFSVPESFEGDAVAATGNFVMPSHKEKILGGHEVCAIDYDDTSRDGDLIVRNSWGQQWGFQPDGAHSRGYFRMPYAMLFGSSRLVMDIWALKLA